MAEHTILVPKANDRQVLDFFDDISQLGFHELGVRLFGGNRMPLNELGEAAKVLKRQKSQAIIDAQSANGTTTLVFERGERVLHPNNVLNPSIRVDTIRLSYRDNLSADLSVAIAASVDKAFFRHAEFLTSDALTDLVAAHDQVVTKLEQTAADIAQRLVDARGELDKEYGARAQTFEAQFAERAAKADEEHRARLAELEDDRAKLKEREAKLDDRDNTHVRRDIRREFKQRLASYTESFTLTKGTQRLRRPIHIAVWLTIILIGVGIYYFISQAPPAGDLWVSLFYLAKPLTLTLAAVGLVAWYLRWMTRWSDQHASTEFRLKQLELDMDRASWVVETALEWKQQEGAPYSRSFAAVGFSESLRALRGQ